jgi:hypothetical protein
MAPPTSHLVDTVDRLTQLSDRKLCFVRRALREQVTPLRIARKCKTRLMQTAQRPARVLIELETDAFVALHRTQNEHQVGQKLQRQLRATPDDQIDVCLCQRLVDLHHLRGSRPVSAR